MATYVAIAVIIAIAAFAGAILGQVVLSPMQLPDINALSSKIDNLANEIDKVKTSINSLDIKKEVDNLSIELDELKSKIASSNTENIDSIKKDIESLNMKLNSLTTFEKNLATLEDRLDEIHEKIDNMKSEMLKPSFTATLDKTDYNAGDSLTVSGTGLPNKALKIALLDKDGITLSEGSTVADSSGRFTFIMQLSRSFATGTYTIKVTQESNVTSLTFRITNASNTSSNTSSSSNLSTSASISGLSLRIDKPEYKKNESITISGNTTANTIVDLDIYDSSNKQVGRVSTRSDATGNFRSTYTIDSNMVLGIYTLKATAGSKQVSVTFKISETGSTSSTSSSNSSSTTLTISTGKSLTQTSTTFKRGDALYITGKAPINADVKITITPPSGGNFLLTTKADGEGKYKTLFVIADDDPTGSWNISAVSGSETASIKITVS